MFYLYKIGDQKVVVAAASTTVAKHGLNQKFPGASATLIHLVDDMIQVQGTLTLEAETKTLD